MPELPEVEVVRTGLKNWLMGATITDVQVLDQRSIRRHQAGVEDFLSQVENSTITNISRRGKYLWFTLDTDHGPVALVTHLGMSGQLLLKSGQQRYQQLVQDPDPALAAQLKHLKVLLTCTGTDGTSLELWFVDQRIFGGLFVDTLIQTDDGAPAGQAEVAESLIPAQIAHIARDPLDQHFDSERLYRALRKKNTGLKRALLDQSLISGIGNIYADEALYEAKLHYQRRTAHLTRREVTTVVAALKEILLRSLAAGGTSFDALYVDVSGTPGYFARDLEAYGRENQACRRCQRNGEQQLIRREAFMNRSSYYCPKCQPRPRNRHA
ncbi:bifunctional DNA-formamidopyrimidine glycosylase/DNA-(apurinic or apyrimidinic site) lyase [Micrococcoides hystricis]|uniref:Bifunctional DNA-formamidopyrimidine glycosylase/DNA-(Apurinic or apyrimidinic site) lyase n=1 Tax=Micrococcoides hystricis TaxID=1572761 RepID=A0ABV6PC34_9MICC